MFFCYENFENNNGFINVIEKEKEFILSNIRIQKTLKNIIINYMTNFATSSDSTDLKNVNNVVNSIENLKKLLNMCNENIISLENSNNNIDTIILNIQNNNPELKKNIESFNLNYSQVYSNILKNTLEIEAGINSISKKSYYKFDSENITNNESSDDTNTDNNTTYESKNNNKISTDNLLSSNDKLSLQNNPQNSTKLDDTKSGLQQANIESHLSNDDKINGESESKFIENTLIISETSQKVFLPYKVSSLKEELNSSKNKYTSLDEIIEKKYTISMDKYKSSSISRFKEGFKLMRNKENGSILEAIDLGLELMFNYNLHPAIITACNNLDELDIYLDYLEDGKTNLFDCFKIIFDVKPTVISRKI